MSTESAARKAAEQIVQLYPGELNTDLIERIILSAAACQTVAPPTEYPMTYLWYTLMRGELMRVVPELSEGGDVQKLAMAELRCAEKMLAALSGNSTGAAPAVSTPNSNPEDEFAPKGRVIPDLRKREHLCEWQAVPTPRCPVCGSTDLTLYATQAGATGVIRVYCSNDQTHPVYEPETVADLAQFFHPAPSPPQWISVSTPPSETQINGKSKWFWITDGELYDVAIWIKGRFMGHREIEATHWMEPLALPAAPSPQGESK